jgi:transposase-like protein
MSVEGEYLPAPVQPKRARGPGGRPSDYNQKIADFIIMAIGLGHKVVDICRRVGINPATFYEWQREIPEFSERIKRARDDLDEQFELCVAAASLTDPRIALRVLARRKPDVWAEPKAGAATGEPVEVIIVVEGGMREANDPDQAP